MLVGVWSLTSSTPAAGHRFRTGLARRLHQRASGPTLVREWGLTPSSPAAG